MLDGLPELTAEMRAFRENGLPLTFSTGDYMQMGFAIFIGIFLALVLADQVSKRL
jgi:hypothetical protein